MTVRLVTVSEVTARCAARDRVYTEHQADLGLLLYDTALGGTPMQGHQWRWLSEIMPGDVVIEITSRHFRPWEDRIGTLLREEDEPLFEEDELTPLWRDEAHTVQAKEHHWVIQTNTREMRWHDARFIRIPTTKHERDLYKTLGTRCELADCRQCARETWTMIRSCWRQELRR